MYKIKHGSIQNQLDFNKKQKNISFTLHMVQGDEMSTKLLDE